MEFDTFAGQNNLNDEFSRNYKILKATSGTLQPYLFYRSMKKTMRANTETETADGQTIKRGTKSAHVEATTLERGRQKLVHNDIYSACHLFFLMTRLMSDFC